MKDQELFDVKKMEDCYKAVHAFVEMKVLIQSDNLYQTVKASWPVTMRWVS